MRYDNENENEAEEDGYALPAIYVETSASVHGEASVHGLKKTRGSQRWRRGASIVRLWQRRENWSAKCNVATLVPPVLLRCGHADEHFV